MCFALCLFIHGRNKFSCPVQVLWLGQFVFVRILKWRYISNPVSNFIDLAYLANISIFIFDQRHSGYYIHGRNSSQHSDTDLASLNNELIKEEEGLQVGHFPWGECYMHVMSVFAVVVLARRLSSFDLSGMLAGPCITYFLPVALH